MAEPGWWGSPAHIAYTVVVFVALASLDNTAIALIPAMIKPISSQLGSSETALGFLTGAVILVTALSATAWGYLGDRGSRKSLLFWGTMIWAGGAALSAAAGSYAALFGAQMVAAVGLGAIASVGFSVVSDFVAPRRRGLAMSFWGLSQGIGTVLGTLIASQLGAEDYRIPLLVVAGAGFVFALLYLTTYEPPRGMREPELEEMHAAGGDYPYRIEPEALGELWHRPTNRWLILQGLTAQIAYGSLVWIPFLFQAKVEAEGYGVSTATKVGGLFAVIFSFGGLFSIAAGVLGDRLQRRTLRARAIVSAVGILGAIPFFLLFFFLPMRGLEVTEGAGTLTLVGEVAEQLFTNPWVAATFLSALTALAFTSADSPNWFALISDVNLPEHRGTVFGFGNLANGVGRSTGNALTGATAGAIESAFPPPLNWAVGLALFQVFFLPTGYWYWRAAGSSPADILEVRATLAARGTIQVPR